MRAEDVRAVAVIGAGLMGHGIAQVFAQAGYDVRIHDLSPERLDQALADMRANLERLAELGLVTSQQAATAPGRVRACPNLAAAAADADLVVEAVFESVPVKQGVFRELDRLCPPRAILASNTSAIPPSTLAAATARPDRVLVTHYFNPPYLIPLVEVVRGEATSDETVEIACAVLRGLGKRPAVLRKEAPGFIANRLQMAVVREALSLVEQGVATPQDIDTVISGCLGRRWCTAGVFEVFDLAGWDVIAAISESVTPTLDSSERVTEALRERVARGALGVKAGRGFYEWSPEQAEALRQRIATALVRIGQWQ